MVASHLKYPVTVTVIRLALHGSVNVRTCIELACNRLKLADGHLGTDVGPNGVTTSLVTKTVGWATAVATFELETLSEYKNLRQSITVTSTFSATATTTSSAGSGIETAAVVVLAGGVAWFLAGNFYRLFLAKMVANFSADITGPVAIMNVPAPQNAKGHDDDKSCPNPKDKCSDCGGSTQMCTTGAHTGCKSQQQSDNLNDALLMFT